MNGQPVNEQAGIFDFEKLVRDIPDHPKPGVTFKDITPLLKDGEAFAAAVAALADGWGEIDIVCGIDARGFILGPPVAVRLGVGFIPARKGGKLPWEIEQVAYSLEYGEEHLELHKDAVHEGQRVLVVDDVLATGGTAEATGTLVRRLGGVVVGYSFLIELDFLGGQAKLGGSPVRSLIHYA